MNNFLYILLIGPMIEEKYGSINLLIMILITSGVTGIINSLIGKHRLLGASGIVFMLIILSSLVNLKSGMIPITLILIFIFYIANEIFAGIFKKFLKKLSSTPFSPAMGFFTSFRMTKKQSLFFGATVRTSIARLPSSLTFPAPLYSKTHPLSVILSEVQRSRSIPPRLSCAKGGDRLRWRDCKGYRKGN